MSGTRPSAAATAGRWVLGLLVGAGLGCNGDATGASGTGSTGTGATTETTPSPSTTVASTTTVGADTTATTGTTRPGGDDHETTTTFGPDPATTTFGPDPTTTTGPGHDTRGEDGGTCCVPHGTPGCDVPGIQTCVCGYDRYCCASEWDALCVEQAINDCGAICMGVDTDTDTDTATDGEGGDCCMAHAARGCDDETCEAAVCGLDPVCCEEHWDGLCADQAVTACPFLCSDDATT